MRLILNSLSLLIVAVNLIDEYEGRVHDPSNFLICSKYNCPPARGSCTRDNKCVCIEGYTTIQGENFGNFQCNYHQKSQTKAFLLEFIIGFGVGHFYLENYTLAIAKLTFCFMAAFIICFLPYSILSVKSQRLRNVFPYLQTVFGIIYCAWQVTDGVMIGVGMYKDGNGIKMSEW